MEFKIKLHRNSSQKVKSANRLQVKVKKDKDEGVNLYMPRIYYYYYNSASYLKEKLATLYQSLK